MAEKHVPITATKFGTLGRFSEEGGEAVHVWYKRAAYLCRTIKNQAEQVRASLRHLEAKQAAGSFQRAIKRRRPRA